MVALSSDRVNSQYHNDAPHKPLSPVHARGNGSFPLNTMNGNSRPRSSDLLARFIQSCRELEDYKEGKPVVVDGQTLSITAVAAAARYGVPVGLDSSFAVKDRIAKSRDAIVEKIKDSMSVYGVTTGYGGSAVTRTSNTSALGAALFQHQNSGVLPTSTTPPSVLPLSDPLMSTAMPESWVRGAILVRLNSLIRGHSAVRWELIEKLAELLREDIVPLVPLRGTISASGDLAPLSYIAGTLIGNPAIHVFCGPKASNLGPRQIMPSRQALKEHGVDPIVLQDKEHLGLLNGTAFSSSVAALALNEAVHLALLAQVCTAMGTEALLGTIGSFLPFIHDIARPHPGQIESARMIRQLLEGSFFAITSEEEVTISEDKGQLRQDRYPLRTAPQFLGPQIEDIIAALDTVTRELNSTTDNPLVDGTTGRVHNGGNFQAMAISNAMEKTRLALHHVGKILFAQATELSNPKMNRGLPPDLAATDPSLNYHTKGMDIATAAYVGELGFLANPVSTHVQSAEMHNQAVNSLALISARATITSLEVLSLLVSTYLYMLCQALDLRAMQHEFREGASDILRQEVESCFGSSLEAASDKAALAVKLERVIEDSLDTTTSMDAIPRMQKVAASTTTVLFDFLSTSVPAALTSVSAFRNALASRLTGLLTTLRHEYLTGAKGAAPASPYINKTKPVYEFVRLTLGIKMHGHENLTLFEQGLGVAEGSLGQSVSLIHESIRDGRMQGVVMGLFN